MWNDNANFGLLSSVLWNICTNCKLSLKLKKKICKNIWNVYITNIGTVSLYTTWQIILQYIVTYNE
jgi:hypothetical protein